MPFHYLLTNLLADVPGAVAAAFLDGDGEVVEWVTRHGEPFAVKVEGAYHAVFLRELAAPLERLGFGRLRRYMLVGSRFVALTHLLPDGYYVVLLIERGDSAAQAWHHLERVAAVLGRELA